MINIDYTFSLPTGAQATPRSIHAAWMEAWARVEQASGFDARLRASLAFSQIDLKHDIHCMLCHPEPGPVDAQCPCGYRAPHDIATCEFRSPR